MGNTVVVCWKVNDYKKILPFIGLKGQEAIEKNLTG